MKTLCFVVVLVALAGCTPDLIRDCERMMVPINAGEPAGDGISGSGVSHDRLADEE